MNKSLSLLAMLAGSTFFTQQAHANTNDMRSFNPAISVIIDGLYYHDSADGEGMEILEEHDSALHSGGHAGHEHGAFGQGFNLRELELTMSGSIDSYFDAYVTLAVSDGEAEIEEAWFQTRSLPAGLTLKGGKFLSAIGYHNEKHLHSWDFTDQNLAYMSLFGDHGLSDAGVQLSWLAPSSTFLQIGAELLQGSDLEVFGNSLDGDEIVEEWIEEGFANPPGDADDLGLPERKGPLLSVAYMRIAPDLGTRQALQLGASIARHGSQQAFHEEGADAFISEGSANLYGLQAVYKRFSTGAYGKGSFAIQAEAFQVESDQTATYHTDPLEIGAPITLKQQAAYIQTTWGFAPRWSVGLRHAAAGINGELVEDGNKEEVSGSRQNSVALTWQATEFSKLRLQANRSSVATDTGREDFNQIMLQYNMSLGAHGAHTF
ncbi:hypothetical protein [Alcanivorax sp. 1008]|uniref:hypothetical protein n=1 Tax=Alcanivorax sp. 1008 TaxID=2816853 RepID=UPI001DE4827C|nr:hypothetical protein [Alcanivorax sp. 1008]MCC1497033.1 hypothetical protein [Alcanivorax sp. 1008]